MCDDYVSDGKEKLLFPYNVITDQSIFASCYECQSMKENGQHQRCTIQEYHWVQD